MPRPSRPALAITAALALACSLPVLSHLDDKEPLQSYRQSYFTLVAMNFGPIAGMVKGEMPWDDAKLKMFGDDLAALAAMDVGRAFAPGSDKGRTRAKPGIWDNTEDFSSKLDDLRNALTALQVATDGGDKAAVAEAVQSAGGTCKACHDEYKSKDYLY